MQPTMIPPIMARSTRRLMIGRSSAVDARARRGSAAAAIRKAPPAASAIRIQSASVEPPSAPTLATAGGAVASGARTGARAATGTIVCLGLACAAARIGFVGVCVPATGAFRWRRFGFAFARFGAVAVFVAAGAGGGFGCGV
jgi:hypothetical protein